MGLLPPRFPAARMAMQENAPMRCPRCEAHTYNRLSP